MFWPTKASESSRDVEHLPPTAGLLKNSWTCSSRLAGSGAAYWFLSWCTCTGKVQCTLQSGLDAVRKEALRQRRINSQQETFCSSKRSSRPQNSCSSRIKNRFRLLIDDVCNKPSLFDLTLILSPASLLP